MKKCIALSIVLMALIKLISVPVYATDYPSGSCYLPDGSTKGTYDFNINTVVSDPTQNTSGEILPAVNSNSSGSFSVECSCQGDSVFYTHQWTTTDLVSTGTSGSLNFYKANDYLSVAGEIKNPGDGTYYSLPLVDFYKPVGGGMLCNDVTSGFHFGNNVRVTFRIDRKFVGTVSLPHIKLFDLWYTVGSDFVQGSPVATAYIDGQISVPQTCSVNAGQIVTVDFGSFMSGEFKNKGQMPTGYTPKTISVPIKCNGIEANANLTVRFQAEASADEPAAIKTSNDDVGVQITDNSGKVIEPNSGLLPFQLDDNLQATVTFHAAPISTTGNAPAEGTFSATAYIRVDFA
ncbi:TPA: fimbrial protein [Klebsiella michiganensis]|uniref:fimbrial protein n=1 Tax=Klebsiella michiganensis TaxID=1134687 RepID=UPI001CC9F102|nr:fimbrial protein [Klebsiella michiganensis]ELT9708152.1 fimbrial protein [Klebsiella michiganensis]MDL4399727.1 fimbrial protein [Klebsiella michiganensis]MDL4530788.1 fimbrial protein [Klebsiella michiganensis]UTX58591.1 fimbrial protein [Klebsiella michiganensis]HCE8858857.1 fimbrial protein [Klebsiella michiganensis]